MFSIVLSMMATEPAMTEQLSMKTELKATL